MLWAGFKRLVFKQAHQYVPQGARGDFHDVVQAGFDGLLLAAERFDPGEQPSARTEEIPMRRVRQRAIARPSRVLAGRPGRQAALLCCSRHVTEWDACFTWVCPDRAGKGL